MSITTRAAIARAPHVGWELVDLQLDEPKAHEVRVKLMAAGLCHSDDHITTGDAPIRLPVVGGHEGAGIVESVGPDVQRVKPGDKIVCSYIPACGACRPCSTGHSEHVRERPERRHRHVRGRHVAVPRGRHGHRRLLHARHLLPVRGRVGMGDRAAARGLPGHPVGGPVPGGLRRADRLGVRGARGRGAGRRHRGDLRRGRRGQQRGAGRPVRGSEERGRGGPGGVQAGDGHHRVRRHARVRHRQGSARVRRRDHLGPARRPRDHDARRGHRGDGAGRGA